MVSYPFGNITSYSIVGLMQYIDSTTQYLFGPSIVCTVWLLVILTQYSKSPRFSFVTAGLFASMVAMFLSFMGVLREDFLLYAFSSFVIPLTLIALTPARIEG